ncbi:MAG: hypothetical protein ABI809_12480, partial [Caldimonas sp.]
AAQPPRPIPPAPVPVRSNAAGVARPAEEVRRGPPAAVGPQPGLAEEQRGRGRRDGGGPLHGVGRPEPVPSIAPAQPRVAVPPPPQVAPQRPAEVQRAPEARPIPRAGGPSGMDDRN